MQKQFKFPEIWLVTIPLLFLVINQLWFNGVTIDVHVYDTIFVILRSHILWVLLFLMILYLAMHMFLLLNKWRNSSIGKTHLIGTIICLSLIGIVLLQPEKGLTIKITTMVFTLSVFIFVIFQIFFFLYFLIEIVKRIVKRM